MVFDAHGKLVRDGDRVVRVFAPEHASYPVHFIGRNVAVTFTHADGNKVPVIYTPAEFAERFLRDDPPRSRKPG